MKKQGLEVVGSTVEEAVQIALKKLNLPRNKVKIEILSEEKRGLFGMPGASLAKIRVNLIEAGENHLTEGGK
ncbi:MAG: Jag N-terminal domain-containing protein [Candidatus Omnitrophica bacterium]|jgi:spoIIIJ-associated protein|nr:Jag N-terminal domain-containing protein [Candidatus Omnitrophota bacterium]